MCQVMEGVQSSQNQPDFLQGPLLGGYDTPNLGRVVTRSMCPCRTRGIHHMWEPAGSVYIFSNNLARKSVRYLVSLPALHKWGHRGRWGWGQVARCLNSGCLSTDFSQGGLWLWVLDPSQSSAGAERWGGYASDCEDRADFPRRHPELSVTGLFEANKSVLLVMSVNIRRPI